MPAPDPSSAPSLAPAPAQGGEAVAPEPGFRRSALLASLVGDSRFCSLEYRVFNAILLLLVVTELLSTVQNLLAGIPFLVTLVTAACAVIALGCYLVSRFLGFWRPLLVPIYIFGLGGIAVAWIAQDGIFGSAPYYYFLLIAMASVLFNGGLKWALFLVTAATLLGLVVVQWRWPALIQPYASRGQHFGDLAFASFLCLAITSVMVLRVYLEYQLERKRNEGLLKAITREKEALVQAMVEKHRLLSMVCHDIGNALTIIQCGVDLETSEGRNPGRIRFAAENIQEIISSVRMLEAIEQGSIPFQPEPVALGPVLDKLRSIFQEQLQKHGITLELPLAEAARPVLAEPNLLANHVLNNLVSNAIKFSPSGSAVTIEVEDLGAETRIGVTDQGMGMPAELLSRLFVPGAVISRRGERGERGTGLGLLTVRSFAELFGGRLQIASRSRDSSPDQHGTTASIYLKNAVLVP